MFAELCCEYTKRYDENQHAAYSQHQPDRREPQLFEWCAACEAAQFADRAGVCHEQFAVLPPVGQNISTLGPSWRPMPNPSDR